MALAETVFPLSVIQNLVVPEDVSTWDWVQENIYAPNGTRFNADAYPFAKGPCDAFDDPNCRRIVMQWGSRLGKTFIAQSIMQKVFKVRPMPCLFVTASENTARDIIAYKLYPMLENTPALRDQLKNKARRSSYSVDMANCRCKVAWSGSTTRLADYAAYFEHLNEVDKWDDTASSEADSLKLAFERAKEFPDRKIIIESTPSVKGSSRVESQLDLSNNCRFQVPCPECHRFQRLKMSQYRWQVPKEGPEDPDLARETAFYVCEYCGAELHDEHKAYMVRRGIWVPQGCHVDDGELRGTPQKSGNIWGSKLESHYSLVLTLGDVAAEEVESRDHPKTRQNFINSWLASTYEAVEVKTTPEQLMQRCATELPRAIAPIDTRLITAAVDVQEDHFKVMVTAWGPDWRCYLIDYGELEGWDDIAHVLQLRYPVFGTQRTIPVKLTLIDSGYQTSRVYGFCKEHHIRGRGVLPCKGSSGDLSGDPFKLAVKSVSAGKRTTSKKRTRLSRNEIYLVHVNTNYYQDIVQAYLTTGTPGEPHGLSFCVEAASDIELAEELLNEVLVDKIDTRGYNKKVWVKRFDNVPQDYRDALRYCRCAADLINQNFQRTSQLQKSKKEKVSQRWKKPIPA